MKKNGFTMIELIFVIVILGILAAVALPKFIGVSQQAHEANLKSFVGTLNRTTGPTLWSKSISKGKNGDIAYLDIESNLSDFIDLPKEINSSDINLSNCNSNTNYKIVMTANKNVAGADYFIACKDGNANQSPVFVLYKLKTGTVTLGDNNTTAVEDTTPTDTYSGNEQGDLIK